MDTAEMKGEHGECGECRHGMHGCCGHRHLGRVIVKILVVAFVFWLGVQVGEFKSVLHGYGGYGYGMMGAYRDSAGQNYFYGNAPGGMMGGWSSAEVSTTTAK